MPRRGKRASPTGIDTVPLPEKVVRGKLDRLGDGYVLTVGAKRMPLAVGTLVDPAAAKQLAGKAVAVAFSAKQRGTVVAIGTWPTPETPEERARAVCYWWICYRPIPELLREIGNEVRERFLQDLRRAGVISEELGREIHAR